MTSAPAPAIEVFPEPEPPRPRLRHSLHLGQLAKALAAAQAKFPAVRKEQTADVEGTSKSGAKVKYSYTYADLADLLAACRPHLAAEGIAIMQPLVFEDGQYWLITRLQHESEQWIESVWQLAGHQRPQDFGGEMTYARRYMLQSLVGIAAEEDDDGADAQRRPGSSSSSATPPPECPRCHDTKRVGDSKFGGGYYCFACKVGFGGTAPTEESRSSEPTIDRTPAPPATANVPTITAAQRKKVQATVQELGLATDHAKEIVRKVAGVDATMLIAANKYDAVMAALKAAGGNQ